MRTKSKYRRQEFKDGGRVDQLASEQPPEAVSAPPEALPVPPGDNVQPSQPVEPQPELPQRDDATLALQKQIEGLRRSEQLQRQQALPPQPMSREQRLEAWRAQGISDSEAAFFVRNPEMLDRPEVTGFAIHKALEAGHPRGSDAHFDFVKKAFNANINHLQAQAQPVMQTPAFFKPPSTRSAPSPASFTSAPVSREIPNSSGERLRPRGQVKLTPAEVEAARISGITPEEYAKQKIRKAQMVASGEYGEQPR